MESCSEAHTSHTSLEDFERRQCRGKDRDETGTIKRVIRSQTRVIDEGKNLEINPFYINLLYVKKHIKQGQGHQVGIFTVEAPLHVSNV
ncbi:putative ribosomal protein L24 [Helianthus annuus]|uniref:Ribosomal protein L24 n=1 Tax=Helianthus annuus TaxID=4232 RepID=A0A9K3JSG4_HELAN|nr:putative ribosomal protein L24 [Helianthus annuus]KAJ0606209.1 putative ribosomal protein L24 [Helianthus annuus]KAJ0617209.1 putative ribosomal protein L24 [Helianthus annuus]KAJ0620233.1 putative ribosomal protein L24 [Helianthus annuus]KAJ0778684.1 putative ribosomal protein L24 [Helianthus annuus]